MAALNTYHLPQQSEWMGPALTTQQSKLEVVRSAQICGGALGTPRRKGD